MIKDSLIEGNKVKLVAEDLGSKLNYITIRGLEISPYLSPTDAASLLLMPFFEEGIRMGNVSGISDVVMRDFIVIVPVRNLILKEGITICNVEFYDNFIKLDDTIISRMNYGKNISDWNSNATRARVIISAREFSAALYNGYNKISVAIDLIALRNELSFPRLNIKGKNEYLNFHYNEFIANVTIPPWVYCREDKTKSYAIYNTETLKNNVLNPEYDPLKYFDLINQMFSEFLCKDSTTSVKDEEEKQNKKRLLLSLHWLRRAIQNGDNVDKLLDLWTAMEFLISGTKVVPLFSKEEKGNIKRLLSLNLELKNEQKKVLFDKIDNLNNTSLMAKIYTMKEELEVDLTNEELELLDSARRKRNDIIHGKRDVVVCNKELNKLRSIIERFLIGKMKYSEKN